MRVLLANHALVRFGGTETWTYEMARTIQNQGHDVVVYTLLSGPFAEQMGVEVTTNPLGLEADLALVNHKTCQGMLQQLPIRKVYTQHGPTHRLEQAIPGGDVYVGVSEEVVATLAMRGHQANLIRNGVDLQRFRPLLTRNPRPKVLSLCKNVMGRDMVREACEKVGYDFDYVQWQDNPQWDVSAPMRDADIVVSYGRGAYEALACGKAVMVFDARSESPRADGWLTDENVRDVVQFNCSGRQQNLAWDVDDIASALKSYEPNTWGRKWAERHHNIEAAANKYLSFQRPDWFRVHDDVVGEVNI